MRKAYLMISITALLVGALSGCSEGDKSAPATAPEIAVATDIPVETPAPEKTLTPSPTPEVVSEDVSEDSEVTESDAEPDSASEPEENKDEEKPSDEPKTKEIDKAVSGAGRTVVWLGDSLTQGSLGDDNDNLANAPYVKLQSMIPNKVEGYGLYGYPTHDIFWVYKDEGHYNQTVDPDKIYIFWVGSNDWCPIDGENTNTAPVIAEIDSFLASYNGKVNDYIVIGTTQRWRLGLERAQIINADLKAHYGSHYLEVTDIIAKNGFSSDNTHLSQASYDAIAAAVANKLKALGYI